MYMHLARRSGRQPNSGRAFVYLSIATLSLSIVLLAAVAIAHNWVRAANSSAPPSRYFSSTGYTVSGSFLSFYESNGGLPIFGFPISNQVVENGRPVQYFERQRFEYHSEAAGTVNEVQLSRLGVEQAPPAALTVAAATTDPSVAQGFFFNETKHLLGNPFLSYWKANGGLRIFGFPISEAVNENGRVVQYFERARMEYHPENAANGNIVELGLLGRRSLDSKNTRAVAPVSRGAAPADVVSTNSASSSQPLTDKENTMLALINNARAAKGIAAVGLDASLRDIALFRSRDMATQGYFSHTAPDGSTFMSMIGSRKIKYQWAGEIIANNNYSDKETATEAFNSFMNSPHHLEILLDPRYNVAGVGEAADGRGFHYFTVVFIQR